MIKKILTYYAQQVDEFLRDDFPLPEGVVDVSFIDNSPEGKKNKLLVSLLSVERDPVLGISATRNTHLGGQSVGFPALQMNLNIILAAVYDEKRYLESLSVLSSTLLFLQSMPKFMYEKRLYTIEIISPSSQELNNIWTSLGGQYYPSVVCKLKGFTFDAGEITQTNKALKKSPIIGM